MADPNTYDATAPQQDAVTPKTAEGVNPYTGKPLATDVPPPPPKPVAPSDTKTFADWMAHDPGLVDHETVFRTEFGPSADQLMDMATLNLRLATCGIDHVVESLPPEEAPPPPPPPAE